MQQTKLRTEYISVICSNLLRAGGIEQWELGSYILQLQKTDDFTMGIIFAYSHLILNSALRAEALKGRN